MKIEKKPCINIKTEQRHGYHEVDLTNSFEDFIRWLYDIKDDDYDL